MARYSKLILTLIAIILVIIITGSMFGVPMYLYEHIQFDR